MGRSRDVTELAGVGDLGYGLGVTAGDYDNDGDADLYISNFGPNVLYRNNGDGTFAEVTAAAGVARGDKLGAGTCFFDMEGDGDLDLYAANYVDFNYDNHITRMIGPYQFHPGPADYRAVPDNLFRNNGDGTFTDVSIPSGVASVAGAGMGTICFDYEDDGDSDVFVCNDAERQLPVPERRAGDISRKSACWRASPTISMATPTAAWGSDCGDFDGDGRLDLFMTDYQDEFPVLYRNRGDGTFDDVTRATGAGSGTFPHVKWGTGFVDFDQDGDRDLFIACGHFMDNIHHIDDRTRVRVPNVLLMNTGRAKFVDVSAKCGNGLAVVESSHGAAFDDLDNDGDIDAVIMNTNALPTILRNESRAGPHWLQLRLSAGRPTGTAWGPRPRRGRRSGPSRRSSLRPRLPEPLRHAAPLRTRISPARRSHRGSLARRWKRRITDVAANRQVVIIEGKNPPDSASRSGPRNSALAVSLRPEKGEQRGSFLCYWLTRASLDVFAVGLDGPRTHSEQPGNLRGIVPLSDGLEDLQFTVGEAIHRVAPERLAVRQVAQQAIGHPRGQVHLVLQDLSHGVDHFADRFLLRQVPLGAGLKGPRGVHGFIVHGGDEHPHMRPARLDLLDQFQSILTLEREVDDGQIRRIGRDLPQGIRGVGRFAAYLQVALPGDQLRQSVPDDGMIVDDQNPVRALCWFAGVTFSHGWRSD